MRSNWVREFRVWRWSLWWCRRCRARWVSGSDREALLHLVHHVREDLPD